MLYEIEKALGPWILFIWGIGSLVLLVICLSAGAWVPALIMAACVLLFVYFLLGTISDAARKAEREATAREATKETRQSSPVPSKDRRVAMKHVVSGKLYDTSTAEKIGSYEETFTEYHDQTDEDIRFQREWSPSNRRCDTVTIYRSKKGQYFVHHVERVRTYNEPIFGGEGKVLSDKTYEGKVELISPEEAFRRCQNNGLSYACSRMMKDIEEG